MSLVAALKVSFWLNIPSAIYFLKIHCRAPRPLNLENSSHPLARSAPVRRTPARPRQGPTPGGPISVTESAMSPIDVLKKENELLKRIIESSEYSIDELQRELDSMGIEIPESL